MRARVGIAAAAALATAMIATGMVSKTEANGQGNDAASRLEQGDKLFHAKCGYCHLQGGTGTIMLGFRLGKDKALLEDRTNLKADYIKHVARSGIGSMPLLYPHRGARQRTGFDRGLPDASGFGARRCEMTLVNR